MPKGTKVARCVEKVKAKGGGANPYAVCQASTGQSYATGKKRKRAGKGGTDMHERNPHMKMHYPY